MRRILAPLALVAGLALAAFPAAAAPPYAPTPQDTARAWSDLYARQLAIVAALPLLNGDGGALAHVTNWPSSQTVAGSVTANIGTTGGLALDASAGTTNTDLGPPGATACATDSGSCSMNALLQRNNQRITSLISALGSPLQAGGVVTANIGTTNGLALDTSIGTTNMDVGPPGATACATDNGSCSMNALLQRNNQRITSLITAVGSPFQAGGSIGNTAFIANAGTNLNTSALALDATLGTTNTDVGPPGATACTTDNGSCSMNALLQRANQRITSLITVMGSPLQAGGAVTANIGTTNGLALDATLGTTNTDVGPPGATACVTDNGSCSMNALLQRNNQRVTSLITAVGSPFQAGGSIGNTAFIANAGTNLNTSALALDATLGTTNTDVGAPGAAACATDTASCSLNQQMQRLAQRITSLIAALGSPFQAGGSVGNTAFTANAGTNLNTSALALDATLGTTNTDVGAPGATACATDTGSCSLNAYAQRLAQRLTTIISTLGSPLQAGGAVNAQPTPVTSGGLTITSSVAANSTNSTNTKGSAGQVYEIRVFNNSGTIAYLKLYNKATAPTCGTDTPVDHFMVPGLTGGSGLIFSSAMGEAYGTGIGWCLTGGIADADTTAVAASAYLVTIGYK